MYFSTALVSVQIMSGYTPDISPVPLHYLSNWKWAGNLLHKLNKTQNLKLTQEIRKPGEAYSKLPALPRGGGWATTGTKLCSRGAPGEGDIHSGSQKGRHNCLLKKMHYLRAVRCFIWGKMTSPESSNSQIALERPPKEVGKVNKHSAEGRV